MNIEVYCDGGCRGNGKENSVGGWGVFMSYNGFEKEIYGGELNTTNNKMELTGVIKALEAIKTTNIPIKVYCDSRYVVENYSKSVNNWIKKGWRKSDNQPVKNVELWKKLVELINKQADLEFIWVKGHSINEGNNKADELANKGMDELS